MPSSGSKKSVSQVIFIILIPVGLVFSADEHNKQSVPDLLQIRCYFSQPFLVMRFAILGVGDYQYHGAFASKRECSDPAFEFVGIVFAQHWLRTLTLGVRIMVG